MATVKRAAAPFEQPPGTGELVDIRDLPEYRRRHGLRIVSVSWPMVHDDYARGKRRPAAPNPLMTVELIKAPEQTK